MEQVSSSFNQPTPADDSPDGVALGVPIWLVNRYGIAPMRRPNHPARPVRAEPSPTPRSSRSSAPLSSRLMSGISTLVRVVTGQTPRLAAATAASLGGGAPVEAAASSAWPADLDPLDLLRGDGGSGSDDETSTPAAASLEQTGQTAPAIVGIASAPAAAFSSNRSHVELSDVPITGTRGDDAMAEVTGTRGDEAIAEVGDFGLDDVEFITIRGLAGGSACMSQGIARRQGPTRAAQHCGATSDTFSQDVPSSEVAEARMWPTRTDPMAIVGIAGGMAGAQQPAPAQWQARAWPAGLDPMAMLEATEDATATSTRDLQASALWPVGRQPPSMLQAKEEAAAMQDGPTKMAAQPNAEAELANVMAELMHYRAERIETAEATAPGATVEVANAAEDAKLRAPASGPMTGSLCWEATDQSLAAADALQGEEARELSRPSTAKGLRIAAADALQGEEEARELSRPSTSKDLSSSMSSTPQRPSTAKGLRFAVADVLQGQHIGVSLTPATSLPASRPLSAQSELSVASTDSTPETSSMPGVKSASVPASRPLSANAPMRGSAPPTLRLQRLRSLSEGESAMILEADETEWQTEVEAPEASNVEVEASEASKAEGDASEGTDKLLSKIGVPDTHTREVRVVDDGDDGTETAEPAKAGAMSRHSDWVAFRKELSTVPIRRPDIDTADKPSAETGSSSILSGARDNNLGRKCLRTGRTDGTGTGEATAAVECQGSVQGSEEPHSDEPELWNIDGTDVDLNAKYEVGGQLWYLRERATDAIRAGRPIAGNPVNQRAIDAQHQRKHGSTTPVVTTAHQDNSNARKREKLTASLSRGEIVVAGLGAVGLSEEMSNTEVTTAAGLSMSSVAALKLNMNKVVPSSALEGLPDKDVLKQMSAMTYRPPLSVARHHVLAKVYIHWYNRLTYSMFIWMDFVAFISTSLCLKAVFCVAEGSVMVLVADPNRVCFEGDMWPIHIFGLGGVLVVIVLLVIDNIFVVADISVMANTGALVVIVLFPLRIAQKLRSIKRRKEWRAPGVSEKYGHLYEGFKRQSYLFILADIFLMNVSECVETCAYRHACGWTCASACVSGFVWTCL